MITPEQVLVRARSAIGHKTAYKLGHGGMRPDFPHPWDDLGCDCSGFASWCMGISRFVTPKHPLYGVFDGAWLETTKMFRDATAASPGAFITIPWDHASASDLLVYPDGPQGQGHVGVIGSSDEGRPMTVIHCSSGNFKRDGDAIQETPIAGFWHTRGAVVARCSLVVA